MCAACSRLPLMDQHIRNAHLSLEPDLLFVDDLVQLAMSDITSDLKTRYQALKLQTTLLFPAVKIIVDVPGWGCGGSQQDCLELGHVWSQAQVCRLLASRLVRH